ncbi:MAG TPA: hypothetical protein VL068_02185, partial [Microthrixaceae bacterium]|nr:hypothetical protein [Microthrixaceae bacterium]
MDLLDRLPRLQVGDAFKAMVEWIENNLDWLLSGIKTALKWCVTELNGGLTSISALAVILILAALGWYLRSWAFALFTFAGFVLIVNMNMWDEAM